MSKKISFCIYRLNWQVISCPRQQNQHAVLEHEQAISLRLPRSIGFQISATEFCTWNSSSMLKFECSPVARENTTFNDLLFSLSTEQTTAIDKQPICAS